VKVFGHDMKNSLFRNWVHNLWIENCFEHVDLREPKYTEKEYFNKFKWWLRREFKYRIKKEK
jgi:hypothetical protein